MNTHADTTPLNAAGQEPDAKGASSPTVIDTFCGAGGLSLGLELAGFETVLGADYWRAAHDTWLRNHASPFLLEDLSQCSVQDLLSAAKRSEAPTVFAGGPPCQGFSSAGSRRHDDSRNTLVAKFGHLAVEMQAPFVIFENVEGFLTWQDGNALTSLLETLVAGGYACRVAKVNAANYGAPQLRKRVIVLAGLGLDPGHPEPSTSAWGAPGAALVAAGKPRTSTLGDALSLVSAAHMIAPLSDHSTLLSSGTDLARFVHLRQGDDMRVVPASLRPPSWNRRANRRVEDGTPSERRGGAPAGIRRLRADEPCRTITSASPREFVHPYDHRTLSLRECATIQGFPTDFIFEGGVQDKATLIGNAVAVPVGEALGHHIQHRLAQPTSAQPGVLSFVATASSGYSPALRRVVEDVESRFGLCNAARHGEKAAS